ncbi:MAG: branched-chain amino acid ABC transporter permease [Desulfurococcales archaeon]|nr:branched-chain amino acid ABC transporter permease [Desulfurococcales archaeon]
MTHIRTSIYSARSLFNAQILYYNIIYFVLMPLPLILKDIYIIHIIILSLYYSILTTSWNLLAGYTGLFCLSTHTFSGLAAYISALMVVYLDIPIPVSMILAGFIIAVIGYLIGHITIKMKGIYLALTTWAFAEIARIAITAEYQITRGELGLQVPPLFGSIVPDYRYFYVALALSMISYNATIMIMRSRYGLYLKAIGDDEIAAGSLGINFIAIRKNVFALSAFIAGIAGSFYAHYVGTLSPAILNFTEMGMIIISTLLGGWRTITGPVIGAFTVEVLSEMARMGSATRLLVFSIVTFIIVILLKGSITDLLKKYLKIKVI